MFEKILKFNRPNLSDKSIKAYNSILTNLYKEIFNDEKYNINKFKNNSFKVIEYLNKQTPQNKKNKLSPLVVLLPDVSIYKDELYKMFELLKNQPSPIKEQNLIDKEKIDDIKKELKENANMLFKKENLTMDELQQIQNYIILSLYTMIKPRRLLDYTEMKILNINEAIDNFIKDGYFIFNTFKQSSTKGQQIIKIPKQLQILLNKWIKINPNEYLLYDYNNNKLTSSTLNKRLNKIFDDKISVNSLRHTSLFKYKKTKDKYDELSNEMKLMGSSIKAVNYYII